MELPEINWIDAKKYFPPISLLDHRADQRLSDLVLVLQRNEDDQCVSIAQLKYVSETEKQWQIITGWKTWDVVCFAEIPNGLKRDFKIQEEINRI